MLFSRINDRGHQKARCRHDTRAVCNLAVAITRNVIPSDRAGIERQLEKKIRQLHKEHRGALGSRGFSKALEETGDESGASSNACGLMKTLGLSDGVSNVTPTIGE